MKSKSNQGRRTRRFVVVVGPALAALLAAACSGEGPVVDETIGPGPEGNENAEANEPAATGEQAATGDVGIDDESVGPTVSAEARELMRQTRRLEVESYVAKMREHLTIVETTTLPNGSVYDWVDPDSLGVPLKPASERQTPSLVGVPGPTGEPITTEQAADIESLVPMRHKSDLELNPELRGPAGTMPMIRPVYASYVDGLSGFDSIEEHVAHLRPGSPAADSERLYQGNKYSKTTVSAASSVINGRWAGTDNPTSNTFYINQMNVEDPVTSFITDAEWVGLVLGRMPGMGDNKYRVYSEFFTDGADTIDDYKGGWANEKKGFVPNTSATIALGSELTNDSVVNGAQYESWVQIKYDTVCWVTNCNKAWWLLVNGQWIGHYPVGTGAGMINFDKITTKAKQSAYYGEVWDGTPGTWTNTDMTSGRHPSTTAGSYGTTGFFRDMRVRRASDGTWIVPPKADLARMGGDDNACYTQNLRDEPAPYYTTMWFGGPGRTSSNGCDPFCESNSECPSGKVCKKDLCVNP